MKRTIVIISVLVLIAFVFVSIALGVEAHPGRTDSRGGHTDHSTGEYHYHHGYSAHDHYDMDGDGVVDCPYDFDDKTGHSSSNGSSITSKSGSTSDSDVKQVASESKQHALADIILVLFEHLLIAIAIWLFSSYFLSYIFFLIFGEGKGCSISIISGAVIALVAYIWMVISKLS